MKPYVSPLILRKIASISPRAYEGQPIYACPRCKVAFLVNDLHAAYLLKTKELHTSDGSIHISLRFWTCISCHATLYAANVVLRDSENFALKARIETALEGIFLRVQSDSSQKRAIATMISETERLLAALEQKI